MVLAIHPLKEILAQLRTEENAPEINTLKKSREIHNPWEAPKTAAKEIEEKRQPVDYPKITQNNRVAFFCDTHDNSAIRKHLARYAKQLKEAGFTHFAIEAPDTDKPTFDRLNDGINVSLSSVDVGPATSSEEEDYGGRAGNERVIRAMAKHGLKVVPIDIDQTSVDYRSTPEEQKDEQRESYLAQNIIRLLKSDPRNKVAVFIGGFHTRKKHEFGAVPSVAQRITEAHYSTVTVEFAGGKDDTPFAITEAARDAKIDKDEFLLDNQPYAKFIGDDVNYIIHLPQAITVKTGHQAITVKTGHTEHSEYTLHEEQFETLLEKYGKNVLDRAKLMIIDYLAQEQNSQDKNL